MTKRSKRARRSVRRTRIAYVIVATGLIASEAFGAEPVWPPISPEDLKLQDNPAVPGSSAMILYKEETRDYPKNFREVYSRIKVFRESGARHAEIEIPYRRGKQEVKDLAARTIHPNGRIIEFRDPVYDKTVLAMRRLNYRAKVFTLPDVRPGSIIEYRYRLEEKSGVDLYWPIWGMHLTPEAPRYGIRALEGYSPTLGGLESASPSGFKFSPRRAATRRNEPQASAPRPPPGDFPRAQAAAVADHKI